jgi:hypothetical protein
MEARVVSFLAVACVGAGLSSPQRKFIYACSDGDVDRIKGN